MVYSVTDDNRTLNSRSSFNKQYDNLTNHGCPVGYKHSEHFAGVHQKSYIFLLFDYVHADYFCLGSNERD
jgi:hypothetical protein